MTEEMLSRFVAARQKYIRRQFAHLNPMQQEAVLTTDGPLLLLAGAGSGKTTVLIHRIANLLRYGHGSDSALVPDTVTQEDVLFMEELGDEISDIEKYRADYLCALEPVAPWNVLAITFTNKAANELKERLCNMLGQQGNDVWAMTFHSACCRILRRDAERIGFTSHFTIYDSNDSERIVKEIITELNLDDKLFPPKSVLGAISREKDRMTTPRQLRNRADMAGDYHGKQIARIYEIYQKRLENNNAMDFDDIICHTVRLLQDHEDIRQYYQRKFRYVLVDEYQDTNHMQYLLTSLLAGGYENICVVGDDDQSIYRFRGATIENILDFEHQYRSSRVIRLEQNYRSTQAILNAANGVIAHNLGRKGKRLWTSNGQGDPITVYEAGDERAEANYVAGRILAGSRGANFKDHAVLYRTNAQSNAIEYAFKFNGIPYRIIGGTRFFDRAEVKDMLAYLIIIYNRTDDLRLKRIINNPPRGLGAKTVDMVQRLAHGEGKPMYAVVADPHSYGPLEKSANKLSQFRDLIEELAQLLHTGISLPEFYDQVMERTGYVAALEVKPTEENKSKLENVKELRSSILNYVENAEEPTLAGFLEEIALYTDIEQYNQSEDAVVMMTMHSAKGLEFPYVYLVGMEDGLFPGMRAIGDREEMEEERRLCYVAITRAKKDLTISHARQRMLYGRTSAALPSRFIKEIPESVVVKKGYYQSAASRSAPEQSYARPAPREIPAIRSSMVTASSATAKPVLQLNKGDMVLHTAFGQGLVLSVLPMGGDALLEIAFDRLGTKKLMAKTASAHMKKL